MRTTTNNYKSAIKAPKRILAAKVELYGSTLEATYTQSDAIKSVTIERVAEDSKFFGFGVTHKVNIHLIDVTRNINLSEGKCIRQMPNKTNRVRKYNYRME